MKVWGAMPGLGGVDNPENGKSRKGLVDEPSLKGNQRKWTRIGVFLGSFQLVREPARKFSAQGSGRVGANCMPRDMGHPTA